MADVVERLPFPLSKRFASTVSAVINRNGREIHYTIAGVPFRLATSTDAPLTFETSPTQKNQQDNEPEAGEQTLAGWWLRSQSSWHEGSGARYAEPRGDVREGNQFWVSSNVDVWTPGEARLLKRTVTGTVASLTAKAVALIPDSDVSLPVVMAGAGAVKQVTDVDAGSTATDLYLNGGVTFTHVVATALNWFAAGNNGSVYSGLLGVTTGAPSIWTLTGADVAKPTRICFAKHRLWAVNANKIFELNQAAPGATAAVYTHPSTAWRYTDICDTPGGVLFSGHGNGSSHLQRITLDAAGAVPTLTGATTTAILPSDERAQRISSIAGSMVCIATNKGVRVAVADTSGNLVYGPLFLERTTELPTTGTATLHSAGRFWWLGWSDDPVMQRIDSSVEIDEGVFAHAADLVCVSNPVSSCVRGDRPVVVGADGSYAYRHKTELEATGYLQTGRIRYRTDEVKTYMYVDVSAEPLVGTVTLDILNDADSETRIIVFSEQGLPLSSSQVPAAYGPQRFMSVKLTLGRAASLTTGPVIQSVKVKALPAVRPQRIYTLPLLCYDQEQWSSGQREGYDGFASDRYRSLKAAEDAGGVVLMVNYGYPAPTGEMCHIESMKFVQLVQPDMNQIDGGLGGILMVTLRTLT